MFFLVILLLVSFSIHALYVLKMLKNHIDYLMDRQGEMIELCSVLQKNQTISITACENGKTCDHNEENVNEEWS